MTYTFCTSGAIKNKAGYYANTAAMASDALMLDFCHEAEAEFCLRTNKDWYNNLPTAQMQAYYVADAVSSLAAIKLVSYDTSNYPTQVQAQVLLDVLDNNARAIINMCLDKG